jgi:hypothetical protein
MSNPANSPLTLDAHPVTTHVIFRHGNGRVITWQRFLALALSLCVMLYAIPALSMRYTADDWCYLGDYLHYGTWGSMIHTYNTWTGKFMSNLTLVVTKTIAFVALPTLVVLAVWWIACVLLARQLLKSASLSSVAILGTLPMLLLLGLAPNIEQSFYWQSALFSHTACVFVFTLFVLVFVQKRLSNALSITLCFFFAFLCVGFSEVAIALLPIYAALLFFNRRRGLAGLLGFALAYGLIVFSPGNGMRGCRRANGQTAADSGVILDVDGDCCVSSLCNLHFASAPYQCSSAHRVPGQLASDPCSSLLAVSARFARALLYLHWLL